jgi:biotin synthase
MIHQLIDTLSETGDLSESDLLYILEHLDVSSYKYLREKADQKRRRYYNDAVFMRGLIEFTNYCAQDCSYCGIRASNTHADRYRLTQEEILSCCVEGYQLGYRTFVLQGGEDPWFTDDRLCAIIEAIKARFTETAITVSVGERSRESYQRIFDAGADRYLLRHETASKQLYESLHPGMSFEHRIQCLETLKDIGFQVGAGFMVGLPGQTDADLVMDLKFLQRIRPHMIGIGPFIPHSETPLGDSDGGTVEKTLIMVALTRLMIPGALMPATTAMGTLDPLGREKAIKAGANVVMPNLSPTDVRTKYEIYENKICTGDEAAHCRSCIQRRIESAGYTVDMSRGDHHEHK